MAHPIGKRLGQYDAAAPLSGAEQLAGVQDSRTKTITVDQIKAFSDTSCQCTLVSRYNEVGIPASSIIQYLHTYILPGSTVATDGSWLHIFASGKFAANANFKEATINLLQNGTSISAGYGSQSNQYNNYYWEIDIKVQRSSISTFTSSRKVTITPYNGGIVTGNTPDMYVDYTISSTFTNLWSNDIQIVVTGDSSAASANDITCGQFIVILHKLDANS